MYNFTVRCIDDGSDYTGVNDWTVGKIYHVVDGGIEDNSNFRWTRCGNLFKNVDELNMVEDDGSTPTYAKFELVEDEKYTKIRETLQEIETLFTRLKSLLGEE